MKKNKIILILIVLFLLVFILFNLINKSDYGKENLNTISNIDTNNINFIPGNSKSNMISFEADDKLPSEFNDDKSNIVFSNDNLVIYSSGDNMSLGTSTYSNYQYANFSLGLFVKSKNDLNISNENFVINTNNGSFYSSGVKVTKKGFLDIDNLQYLNVSFLIDPGVEIDSLNLKIEDDVYELKSEDIDKLLESVKNYKIGENKDGASTVSSGGYYI